MSYSITYDWAKEKELVKKQIIPLGVYWGIIVAAAALGNRMLFPESSEMFQELLFPLTDEFTITTFVEFTEQIGAGVPLSEAVAAFCIEIINHAQ